MRQLTPPRRRVLQGAAALAAGAAAGSLLGRSAALAGPDSATHWVSSWTASPTDAVTPVDGAGLPAPVAIADQTLRMIVTPHLGGPVLRIHLTNRFGATAVTFAHVTVGLQKAAQAADQITTVA